MLFPFVLFTGAMTLVLALFLSEKAPITHKPSKPTMTTTRARRHVSESLKKWVAASQGWKCGLCKCTLPACYQVDHKVPLWQLGSNQAENLWALCPNCHGEKTLKENISRRKSTMTGQNTDNERMKRPL